jgi:hypothetical protein
MRLQLRAPLSIPLLTFTLFLRSFVRCFASITRELQ